MKACQGLPEITSTSRLEAFSDAVIAIVITIMVLELKPPHDGGARAFSELVPLFLSYLLSFVLLTIMWVAHHNLLHLARRIDRRLLWANNNVLFWMTLIPFATAYLGNNHTQPFAISVYAVDLACCVGSFHLLRRMVARQSHEHSKHHQLMQLQNAIAGVVYLLAVPLAYVSIYASYAILVAIPIFYLAPERLWCGKKLAP